MLPGGCWDLPAAWKRDRKSNQEMPGGFRSVMMGWAEKCARRRRSVGWNCPQFGGNQSSKLFNVSANSAQLNRFGQ